MSTDQFFAIAQDLEIYHGIFSRIWQMGKPVEDNKIQTACVKFDREGGFFAFCFNSEYLKSLDYYTLKFIICHEALHVILNHGYRSYGLIPEIANVAMDVVINESLIANFSFDRSLVKNEKELCWYDTIFTPEDNIEKNKSFEYYYDILIKKCNESGLEGGKKNGETGSGSKDGSGGEKSKPSILDEHLGFGSESDLDIDDKLSDACSKLSNEEKSTLKNVLDKILDDDMSSSLIAGSNAGGWLKIMDVSKVKSKRKWESVIKRWMEKYLTDSDKACDQWARVNRRFVTLSKELIIPTEMEIEHFNEDKSRIKVIFFLDTSGSCAHLAERFFKAAKTLPEDKFDVVLCCFDTQVYETSLKTGKLYGFGGTMFDILEYYVQMYRKNTNKNKYPDAIFVITDGYGNSINPEFPKKWYWFLSTSYTQCIPNTCNIFQLSDYE